LAPGDILTMSRTYENNRDLLTRIDNQYTNVQDSTARTLR
jgi:hypothetical protein